MRRRLGAFLCLCLQVMFGGCSRDQPADLVVYVSADEHVARAVIQRFEQQTGLLVQMVGDTEAKKTAGLVQRLRSEASHPRADVFWSSEVFMTIDLADEGLLAPLESDALADWPAQWRDAERRWHGFAARARVIVYAPGRVPASDVPRTWMELSRSRFRNRIVMADPRFGTTGGHLGAMKAYWDADVPGYYNAWIEGLADNDVRLLASGNAGVVEAVARGEADVGLTDTDDVWAARERGLDVELVYPRHAVDADEPGGGTLVIPNTAAVIKGAPHPENARRFVEFLLSADVERMLAESTSHNIPIRSEVAAAFPNLQPPDPMQVDLKRAAAMRSSAVQAAMRRLQGGDQAASATASTPGDADS